MSRVAAMVGLLALSGCSSTNIADVIAAMGSDPASVCVHIAAGLYTPAIDIVRINRVDAVGTCGLAIMNTTAPATVNVPFKLTVAPQ